MSEAMSDRSRENSPQPCSSATCSAREPEQPPAQKRLRGRPPSQPRSQSAVGAVPEHVKVVTKPSGPGVFGLEIPNILLIRWHSRVQSGDGRYIECLNSSIVGGVVAIDSDCKRLEDRLASAAAYVRLRQRKLSGRARLKELSSKTRIEVHVLLFT